MICKFMEKKEKREREKGLFWVFFWCSREKLCSSFFPLKKKKLLKCNFEFDHFPPPLSPQTILLNWMQGWEALPEGQHHTSLFYMSYFVLNIPNHNFFYFFHVLIYFFLHLLVFMFILFLWILFYFFQNYVVI